MLSQREKKEDCAQLIKSQIHFQAQMEVVFASDVDDSHIRFKRQQNRV